MNRRKVARNRGFRYQRVIRFSETDAAGVVYFANLLSLCHEAFEASLADSGINIPTFFSKANGVAVPIVHTEADFYRPLICGDRVAIDVYPIQLKSYRFENHYEISDEINGKSDGLEADSSQANDKSPGKSLIAAAQTTHVCIDTSSQRVIDLSNELLQWIAATGSAIAPTPSELND